MKAVDSCRCENGEKAERSAKTFVLAGEGREG
jgi:hypothetical protein